MFLIHMIEMCSNYITCKLVSLQVYILKVKFPPVVVLSGKAFGELVRAVFVNGINIPIKEAARELVGASVSSAAM